MTTRILFPAKTTTKSSHLKTWLVFPGSAYISADLTQPASYSMEMNVRTWIWSPLPPTGPSLILVVYKCITFYQCISFTQQLFLWSPVLVLWLWSLETGTRVWDKHLCGYTAEEIGPVHNITPHRGWWENPREYRDGRASQCPGRRRQAALCHWAIRFALFVCLFVAQPATQSFSHLWNKVFLNPLQFRLLSAVFCHHRLFIEFMCEISILVVKQRTANRQRKENRPRNIKQLSITPWLWIYFTFLQHKLTAHLYFQVSQ